MPDISRAQVTQNAASLRARCTNFWSMEARLQFVCMQSSCRGVLASIRVWALRVPREQRSFVTTPCIHITLDDARRIRMGSALCRVCILGRICRIISLVELDRQSE